MDTNAHNEKIIIAFDVNNTLSDPRVQKLFHALDRNKCHVVVWSSVGAGFAQTFCQQEGIVADSYLKKDTIQVDIAIDDIPESISTAALTLTVTV